ncbi:MAG: bifunctional riboflavin kinase/FAD synthetase [FCB group bacterium]|nr:bifunctional riboflavin kinase/FAD synthetase [FCB group bacterium]
MVIYRQLENIEPLEKSVLTIGSFDGLHRGHQEIIKHAVTLAHAKEVKAVVITFDPHPRHVLDAGKKKLPLLISIDKKLDLFEELQIDVVLVIPFTREFSRVTAVEFMEEIVLKYFHPTDIIIGYDHHFGYRRGGSPDFLKQYCSEKGIKVEVIGPVADKGSILSSTRIRELIADGYVRRANFELGWVYGFRAKVVHGAGRGRNLKFPTANFVPVEKNQLLPREGVYFTRGRVVGQQLYGMCNLGVRPTFGEKDFVMEVHFFDSDMNDLYNQEITIEFLERIRDEKKFASQEELIKQLKKDKQYCLKLLTKYA